MCGLRNPALGVLVVLVMASCAWAELGLAGDKLVLDATVWTSGHVWRADEAGLYRNDFAIERVGAPIGLTGRLNSVASLRLSADVCAFSPMDLYADLSWPSGFRLRVGQFVLPLGFQMMTDPAEQLLVNSPLLAAYAARVGSRDIGFMGGLQRGHIAFTGAVTNGAGVGVGDNNSRKDVCGRVTIGPVASVDGVLALRVFYGWPDASDTVWQTAAAEARITRGPFELQAEFQNHSGSDGQNNAGYLQAAWSIGQLQPVARFDLALPKGERVEWMVTGGLNVQPIADHVRVMLDCTYRRNYQQNWSVLGFLFRLQASI
jgi:hypothetical protein